MAPQARSTLTVDSCFAKHFENLKQVFLYITDRCNLACDYCLYKHNLAFQMVHQEVEPQLAIRLLRTFRQMGASKLTLLGGEPTIYDENNGHEGLFEIVEEAAGLGYEYIRMDTNGLFDRATFADGRMSLLDEVTFSIDGNRPEHNDVFRGAGTLNRALSGLRHALDIGHRVDVTLCVHRGNSGAGVEGRQVLADTIGFFATIGVSRINIHPILRTGAPRDIWTSSATISQYEWLSVQEWLMEARANGEFSIPVRVPQRLVDEQHFADAPNYYGYCSATLGERVLVHPDGIIRCCALLIGSPYGVGRYNEDAISWDSSWTNELTGRDRTRCTHCAVQRSEIEGMVPLCISFKPAQDEYVWQHTLAWERRHVSEGRSHENS